MEIKSYIESGIIESFVLGFALDEELEKLYQLRKLYPELDMETTSVEQSLEKVVFEGLVIPPKEIRDQVLQKIKEVAQK